MKALRAIKTTLRWYSGFFMVFLLGTLAIMPLLPTEEPVEYSADFTYADSAFLLIMFFPIAVYVVWEIVDSFIKE